MASFDLPAVKFVDGSEDTIEGLILPYGGPLGGKDLTKTFFTPKTDFAMKWFPNGGRPGLYRHGFDPAVRMAVVGREVGGHDDERGHWLKAQLDASSDYAKEIAELVRAGKLFLSSGAVDHLVDVKESTGEIRSWPWVEWSLTPRPANPDQPAVAYKEWRRSESAGGWPGFAVKSLDAAELLGRIGVAIPKAIKSWLPTGTTQGDLDDGDFAWLSDAYKAGKQSATDGRKFPYKVHGKINEDGWKAAWAYIAKADPSDLAGGPGKSDVIKALLADKPKGVDVSSKELLGLPRPLLVRGMRAYVKELAAPRRVIAVREGRRNSSTDASLMQQAHDNLASVLSLDCAPTGAGKEIVGSGHVLAIKAGDGSAPDGPDLDAIRAQLAEETGSAIASAVRAAFGRT